MHKFSKKGRRQLQVGEAQGKLTVVDSKKHAKGRHGKPVIRQGN